MRTFPSTDRHDQFFLNYKRCFSSTPSLDGTQHKQQHLYLHQHECGSAAAPPTARMRRVQQSVLHVCLVQYNKL